MTSPLKTFLATIPECREMPRVEVRALKSKGYRTSLSEVRAAVAGETVRTLTCAISASKGRGVLVLTDERLVLWAPPTGITEWALADIDSVRARLAKFTYPAAIYLELPTKTQVLLVGAGRSWGAVFTGVVSQALGAPTMAPIELPTAA